MCSTLEVCVLCVVNHTALDMVSLMVAELLAMRDITNPAAFFGEWLDSQLDQAVHLVRSARSLRSS